MICAKNVAAVSAVAAWKSVGTRTGMSVVTTISTVTATIITSTNTRTASRR